jgi:hypothetical protein
MQRWFLPAQHRPAQPPEARLEGPVLLSPLPRPRLPIQRGPCRATRPAIQLHPAPWRQAPCRNNRPRLLPEEPTTRRRRSRPCRELQERHREHHRQPLRALHRRPDRPHRREAPHLAPLAPTTAQPLPAHPARPLRGALARREPSPNRGRVGKDTRSRWIVSAFDTGDSGTVPFIAQQRAMNGLHNSFGLRHGNLFDRQHLYTRSAGRVADVPDGASGPCDICHHIGIRLQKLWHRGLAAEHEAAVKGV